MIIEVDLPVNSRRLYIILKVGNKVAKTKSYRFEKFPTKEKEYEDYVKRFCTHFLTYKENDLYDCAENYMAALNAHRKLKKVLNKSGKLIWTKP
tara:strand:+ start:3157 stop:3438 length:282 start_codon:yes stop_codon:yes gene_type:complete